MIHVKNLPIHGRPSTPAAHICVSDMQYSVNQRLVLLLALALPKSSLHEPQDALLGNEQVTHFEVHGPNTVEKRKGAPRARVLGGALSALNSLGARQSADKP